MKRSHKIAVGVVTSLSLGFAAAAAHAHPGSMGAGMEHGMQHGMKGGMGQAGMGHEAAGQMSGQQLMTPEERTALMEKMRSAKTPEERQKLAAETHAEMQTRAREKGITLPEHRGPGAGLGPKSGTHAH